MSLRLFIKWFLFSRLLSFIPTLIRCYEHINISCENACSELGPRSGILLVKSVVVKNFCPKAILFLEVLSVTCDVLPNGVTLEFLTFRRNCVQDSHCMDLFNAVEIQLNYRDMWSDKDWPKSEPPNLQLSPWRSNGYATSTTCTWGRLPISESPCLWTRPYFISVLKLVLLHVSPSSLSPLTPRHFYLADHFTGMAI